MTFVYLFFFFRYLYYFQTPKCCGQWIPFGMSFKKEERKEKQRSPWNLGSTSTYTKFLTPTRSLRPQFHSFTSRKQDKFHLKYFWKSCSLENCMRIIKWDILYTHTQRHIKITCEIFIYFPLNLYISGCLKVMRFL